MARGRIIPAPPMSSGSFARLIEGIDWYSDLTTGSPVWTRKFLLERGFCCNGDCRHCPYDENNSDV